MHFPNQMTISQAVGKHVETYQTHQGGMSECQLPNRPSTCGWCHWGDWHCLLTKRGTGKASTGLENFAIRLHLTGKGPTNKMWMHFAFFFGWLDSFWIDWYRVLVYSMASKALQLLGVLSFSELRLAMPVNSKNSNATKQTWEFELEEARVGSSPHCQTSISICQLHPPRKTSSPHLKMYASKRKFRTWKPWFLRSKR